jgi:hypothetical protein
LIEPQRIRRTPRKISASAPSQCAVFFAPSSLCTPWPLQYAHAAPPTAQRRAGHGKSTNRCACGKLKAQELQAMHWPRMGRHSNLPKATR